MTLRKKTAMMVVIMSAEREERVYAQFVDRLVSEYPDMIEILVSRHVEQHFCKICISIGNVHLINYFFFLQ